MSECSGPDCKDESHKAEKAQEKIEAALEASAPSTASNEDKKEEVEARVPKQKMIQAPPYCVFNVDERIPMRGYNWRVVGYTKEFMLVLKCEGMTGRLMKDLKRRQR